MLQNGVEHEARLRALGRLEPRGTLPFEDARLARLSKTVSRDKQKMAAEAPAGA